MRTIPFRQMLKDQYLKFDTRNGTCEFSINENRKLSLNDFHY